MEGRQYEVAISFAGEQRAFAQEIARHLGQYGVAYFYDDENKSALWGKDLAEEFNHIYTKKTNYVLMLISKEYIEKPWCRHERRSAISEGLVRGAEFILPVRFGNAWPPGMPTTMSYLDAEKEGARGVAVHVAQKLGVSLYSGKASTTPPPKSTSEIGSISFDYEAYNGRYILGDDGYAFETAWSNSGNGSIHVYNDGENINGVSIAYGKKIFEIDDSVSLDFSSRCRTPVAGEVVVFRNINGIYAAVEIQEVLCRRGDNPAILRLFYIIDRHGSGNFKPFQVFC